jgi:hypothetical protein
LAEINLTQTEADLLIAMPKVKINNQVWDYPSFGGSISIPLTSTDKKENFILDVSRSHIDLLKGKYQNRGRQVVVLIRLDFGGAPHRNPDGTEISCPHLHLYRENYGDKDSILELHFPFYYFPSIILRPSRPFRISISLLLRVLV